SRPLASLGCPRQPQLFAAGRQSRLLLFLRDCLSSHRAVPVHWAARTAYLGNRVAAETPEKVATPAGQRATFLPCRVADALDQRRARLRLLAPGLLPSTTCAGPSRRWICRSFRTP